MHHYAQTNLQLYAQLSGAGHAEPELAVIGRAYELGMNLFGGVFRPNGKPFLCHLVGTASILVSWHSPSLEVIVGLLHAAYSHGQFADRRTGATDSKRALVRQAMGAEQESLIHEYFCFAWTAEAIQSLASRLESVSDVERAVIRVRLANELEDHLDQGLQYCRKTKTNSLQPVHAPMLLLAHKLVGQGAAEELAANVAKAAGDVPAVLCRSDKRSFRARIQRPHFLARLKALWS